MLRACWVAGEREEDKRQTALTCPLISQGRPPITYRHPSTGLAPTPAVLLGPALPLSQDGRPSGRYRCGPELNLSSPSYLHPRLNSLLGVALLIVCVYSPSNAAMHGLRVGVLDFLVQWNLLWEEFARVLFVFSCASL